MPLRCGRRFRLLLFAVFILTVLIFTVLTLTVLTPVVVYRKTAQNDTLHPLHNLRVPCG